VAATSYLRANQEPWQARAERVTYTQNQSVIMSVGNTLTAYGEEEMEIQKLTAVGRYNILDFFPDCVLPDCPDAHKRHQHILPQQQRILDSTAKYLYMQGGVGGGKTTAFAVKAVWLSLTIRENRGIVSRLNYGQLYDSTWREIKSTIQRLVDKELIEEPEFSKRMFGDYTQIIFRETRSEILAVHSKNFQQALGSNHGWFFVDDAMECPEDFFVGNYEGTTAGLLSRLRLPHVHFDKRTYDKDERVHGALHGMIASNPPPYGHWLHRLFGDKPGRHRLGADQVDWLQGATSDNPFLGADYGSGILSVQRRMGRSENVVKRVLHGESIPAYAGIPVYPQFDRHRHLAPLKFNAQLPLITAWDFGHDHPAIVYSQLFRCAAGNHHYFTLSEVAEVFDATVHVLKEAHDKHMQKFYPDAKIIRNCGDKAGFRNNSANKDGRSDMKILMYEYKMQFKWRYMHLTPSLQHMRMRLVPSRKCPCGLELILISPRCPVLLGALEGGYHFSRPRNGGPHPEKPVEDRYFADVACAWRYGDENYGKYGVDMADRQVERKTERRLPLHRNPFAFLDEPAEEMARKLLA
jgi:hypothetical protein